jgi:uncharacterized protein
MTQEELDARSLNMGKTFVWHECNVPDVAAAKSFYSQVVGFTTQDMPMGEMCTYTMFCNNGIPVGGIMATVGEMANVPPHWSVYISVADVDASASKATELGGKILVPAFDIPTIGRMCLVQDPQGAAFWLFRGAM